MNKSFRSIEVAFTVFSLILLTDAWSFRSLFVASEGSSISDFSSPLDPFIAKIQYIVFSFAFFMIIVSWKNAFRALLGNIFIVLFPLFVIASTYWSDFPEITQRSSTLFGLTSLFGLYLSSRYTLKGQMQLIAYSLGITAILSLLLCLLLPGLAIENSSFRSGSWRGIFYHKNNLGLYMFLSAISLLIALNSLKYEMHVKFRRICIFIVFSISFILLVFSESKTSLLIFLILFLLVPLCSVLRWNDSYMIPFLIIVFIIIGSVAAWFIGNIEIVLVGLGKDITLSGRTDIWGAVLNSIKERLWLGYGYKAFWVADSRNRCLGECLYVRNAIHFDATSAHNGFLDLGAALGIIGTSIFLTGLLISYIRSFNWIRQTKSIDAVWPFLFLTSIVIFTQSESALFDERSFVWAIYVSTTLSLGHSRSMKNRELKNPSPAHGNISKSLFESA